MQVIRESLIPLHVLIHFIMSKLFTYRFSQIMGSSVGHQITSFIAGKSQISRVIEFLLHYSTKLVHLMNSQLVRLVPQMLFDVERYIIQFGEAAFSDLRLILA